MKEWHILLQYIDSYVYDFYDEKIIIKHSPDADDALKVYEGILSDCKIAENKSLKWSFDIALDCVREMSEGDREYCKYNREFDFFGYGLFIRNKYIHRAKKKSFFSADRICSVVLDLISTILHVDYNYFKTDSFEEHEELEKFFQQLE